MSNAAATLIRSLLGRCAMEATVWAWVFPSRYGWLLADWPGRVSR